MAKRIRPWEMFVPTPEHYEAFRWATKKFIRIFPKYVRKTGNYKIVKETNGTVVFISKEEFTKKEYGEKIWEFYLYLYLQDKK